MKIGFFGTGLMGKPMAINLLNAGYQLNVYNRTIEKAKSLEELGATVFSNSGDAIEQSDILISMLSEINAINQVFLPEYDYSGKTIIQMSTISPAENVYLSSFFKERKSEFVESPVLGSIPQIKAKQLIVIVSSPLNLFERVAPLLKNFGEKIICMGEYGKASAAKLALNQLIATETAAFSMSLAFVREYGVDVDKFMEILRNSALYAPTFDKKLDRMMERNFEEPNFPLKHLLKDVILMIDSFSERGVDVSTLMGVKKVIEDGLRSGDAEKDYSSLYNSIHKR